MFVLGSLSGLAGCQAPERLLSRSRELRLAGDREGALVQLERALALKESRGKALSAASQELLSTEAAEAARFIGSETQQHLAAGCPLRAESALHTRASLLSHPELATAREELRAAVQAGGQAACGRLTPMRVGAAAPYTSNLIDQYCAHFGVSSPSPVTLPDRFSGVALQGHIQGAMETDMNQLAALLQAALTGSAYQGANTSRTIPAMVSGVASAELTSRPVALSVNWVEQVPFLFTEFYQEPYQQAYQDTETYTVQVPYTSMETYSYSCGFGTSFRTCTGTRSVTNYRSEMRTRPVTRWRMALRPASRVVTRYTPTPRVFAYNAVEHTGRYAAEISVSLLMHEGEAPLTIEHRSQLARIGLWHDVDFPRAGISPSRPQLPSQADWVQQQLAELRIRAETALAEHWAARFCALPQYNLEEAARCAHLTERPLPEPARKTLEASLRCDMPLVLQLLAHDPAGSRGTVHRESTARSR